MWYDRAGAAVARPSGKIILKWASRPTCARIYQSANLTQRRCSQRLLTRYQPVFDFRKYYIETSNGASAATVTLTDGIVSTTVAISAGDTTTPYSLTGLMSGTGSHTVTVSCAGNIDSATYEAPASYNTASAGLGGTVYSDNNGNGVSGGGDAPIAGATATLLDNTNTPITSTTTSGTGNYSFPGLIPGVP